MRRMAWVVAFVVVACQDRRLATVVPEVRHGFDVRIVQPGEVAVDLLVVVDNSTSMDDEQENLRENFQHLVRVLTTPEDADGDGEPDHAPVTDLHVGIVSTDTGVRGATGPGTCGDDPEHDGDDGILVSTPTPNDQGEIPDSCTQARYPTFLRYEPDATDDDVYRTPEQLDDAFRCLAELGTKGCGYEQPLDALTRALDFHDDGANEGFLRADSLLAVVVLTDEEDCSVRRDLADASDLFTNAALGEPNLRCFRHGDQYLEPVRAFVERIVALRTDHPEKLVVAGITGIPVATTCALTDMGDGDFSCLLADPMMQEVEAADGKSLVPACRTDRGEADPARRLVETIQGVHAAGGSGIVRSICDADFRPAMEAISRLIQKQFDSACLARPLQRDGSGQVACRVVETLDGVSACPAGRIDLGLAGEHRVCQVCQEGDGEPGHLRDSLGNDLRPCAEDVAAGHFWRYVEDAPGCDAGRVVFEGDAIAVEGSSVDLECLSNVRGADDLLGDGDG